MAARPRKGRNRALPDYLRARKDSRTGKTYYAYLGPDGREYGLGTDKAYAIEQARDANLRRFRAPTDLWDRISGQERMTVGRWADEYRARFKGAENTRRSAEVYLRRAIAAWGEKPIDQVTTRGVAAVLEAYTAEGKHRTAQACRARLHDFFRAAEAAGWIERGHNPADVVRTERATVRRARLTLDDYRAIHAAAAQLDPWIQRSMELALVTAQRREDLAELRFADYADGYLHITQRKTGNRVRIPAGLTLDAMGWSVDSIMRACRDAVLSHWVIHHTRPRTKSRPGDKVHKDTVSRGFAKARARSGLTWPDQQPPTLHEVRSLAARLYGDQGVNAQALLGHKDARTTAIYTDVRGAEWIEVKA